MSLEDLKIELDNDIKSILSAEFDVTVSNTSFVPTIDTPGITYPNLDNKEMKTKRIHTCVLYIDIRKSTELNLQHYPITLTRLYAAFMRSMVKAAQHFNGKVRNIIGDRVMVVFDEEDCFVNALRTAFLLNSVAKYILNKHFTSNEITCGIGIDYGRMLVSKGGIVKSGSENSPYKSLVWLGRPANVSSKLTDLANKEVEIDSEISYDSLNVVESIPLTDQNKHYTMSYKDFTEKEMIARTDMRITQASDGSKFFVSSNPTFKCYFHNTKKIERIKTITTPPILITKKVYEEYKKAHPSCKSITEKSWKEQDSALYKGYTIYGINWIYYDIRD